jgi:putative ABC transport system permease protein
MLKTYCKIAWRNIFRQRLFSMINMLGLSLSLASFFLIIQYVGFERSYDRFHNNADRLHRVNSTRIENNQVKYRSAMSVANVGPFLEERFGEVTAYTRLFSMGFNFVCAVSYTQGNNTITFNERNVYYADNNFFNFFAFPLAAGNRTSSLSEPYTAVISAAAARKYFGRKDPLGKTIRFVNSSEEHSYRITGVLGNAPGPSHLDIDFLFSYSSLTSSSFREKAFDNWGWDAIYTYVKIARGINPDLINQKLNATLLPDPKEKSGFTLDLEPLTAIHLISDIGDEPTLSGNKTVIDFLLIIACFIILLAWINYANLVTADTLRRAREIGVRKIIGAGSWHIINQFAIQFILLNVLSLMLAAIFVQLAAPLLWAITGTSVHFIWTGLPLFPLIAFFVSGMLASGGYPAYVLSRLSPDKSIKGTYFIGPRKALTQRVFVGFQFCVSIALITGTLIIDRQLNFMQEADLGMRIDHTLVVKAPIFTDSTSDLRVKSFKDGLLELPFVHDIALSSTEPAGGDYGWVANIKRREEDTNSYSLVVNVVDRNFIGVFDIPLLSGRDFLPSEYRTGKFGDQKESVLINASAVKLLGFESNDEAIRQQIFWDKNRCEVIGVVQDFHQRSMHYAVRPAVFVLDLNGVYYSIKFKNEAALSKKTSALAAIKETYSRFFPEDPFEYFFLEDHFGDQYQDDKRFSTLFSLFAFLALFIASLGLAGLVAFLLLHRKKEIGIRKVLGATVVSLIELVSKGYIKLGLISLILVTPVTYYLIGKWLEKYAHHIRLEWWMFSFPGLMVILVTVLAVSGQSLNAALSNPAESLRSE